MEPYIYEDIVDCEECGKEIVHLQVGEFRVKDPNYYLCLECEKKQDTET